MTSLSLKDFPKKSVLRNLAAAALLGVAAAALVVCFQLLPIQGSSLGIDWQGIWPGLRGGLPHYGTGLRNPPWSLLPILPLGFLPFKTSWGILSFLTLAVEVLSVAQLAPGRIKWLVTVFLITSFPSLRNLADGNIEVLPLAGILISLFAYRTHRPWALALGFLLASAKPQETWLLLVVVSVLVVRTWPLRRILPASVGLAAVVAVAMIPFGKPWLTAMLSMPDRGSVMDSALLSGMGRLGVSPWFSWAVWTLILCGTVWVAFSTGPSLSREKAAFLVSASLLLSPYAAGNNLLAIAVIGVVALAATQPIQAVTLGLLIDLPYVVLFNKNIMFHYEAYYATCATLIAWAVLGVTALANKRSSPATQFQIRARSLGR
ncbi:MAG: glycosyltransferase family 87 protein [Anaerolineales bacterium]